MTTQTVSVRDVLVRARELLEPGHCYGVYARDERGNEVGVGSQRARSWCMYGALQRAASELGGSEYRLVWEACEVIAPLLPPLPKFGGSSGVHVMAASDAVPTSVVLGWMDRAIEAAT